jgi:ketosteroid isomerase-like protein
MSTQAQLDRTGSEREMHAADEHSIREVLATLSRAHREKNASAFAAQFAHDARIFNLAPPLERVGVDVGEKQAWMDSWSTPIEIVPLDFKITIEGGLAFACGFLQMSGTKKGAEGPVRFWMRETLCLKRAGESWRIAHEHTSVPFYMDGTLRPAFDLEP